MARWRAWWPKVRRIATIAGALVGLVIVLLWLAGAFGTKVEPGHVPQSVETVGQRKVLVVTSTPAEQIATAVGTAEPIEETVVGSRLLARVKAVHVDAGDPVKKGDVLVELEDTDLRAALKKAEAAVRAAEATLAEAEHNFEKYKKLYAEGQAARQEYDQFRRAYQVAQANLDAARQARKAAETRLSYATIRSPLSGIVVDKQINVGDMAQPGRSLVKLYNPNRMQLIALVPESLASRLRVGGTARVHIQAIDKICPGTISQIVPEAQRGSRSFRVKVTGPCPPGVFAGMFGRLLIPLGTRREIWIPASAVRTVGQLDMVWVVQPDQTPSRADNPVERRFVRVGRRKQDKVEILSGLSENEWIVASF